MKELALEAVKAKTATEFPTDLTVGDAQVLHPVINKIKHESSED